MSDKGGPDRLERAKMSEQGYPHFELKAILIKVVGVKSESDRTDLTAQIPFEPGDALEQMILRRLIDKLEGRAPENTETGHGQDDLGASNHGAGSSE